MRARPPILFVSLVSLVSLGVLMLGAAGCGHRRFHARTDCPDGMSWDGASCVPLGGGVQQGEAQPAQAPVDESAQPQQAATAPEPQWTCPGGSVAQGEGCVCPEGLSWIGEQCQATPIAQAPVAARRPERRRSAWIPAPPPPPTMPNVNINVNVNEAARALQPRLQPSPRGPAEQPQQQQAQRGSPPPTVTHASCTNGMVQSGNACACPQGTAWESGQCLAPCHPTQRREGNACVCPKDTRWNGSRCELWQECRGGQVHLGASCICPSQTSWDGQRCAPAGQRRR